MRINGSNLISRNFVPVTISRAGIKDIVLRVGTTPFNFAKWVEGRGLIQPQPPVEYAKDPKTGKTPRDPDTGYALQTERIDDPAYQAAFTIWNARITALRFQQYLRDEPAIEFDSREPDESQPHSAFLNYCDNLVKEIAEVGLSHPDVAKILEAGGLAAQSTTISNERAINFSSGMDSGQ